MSISGKLEIESETFLDPYSPDWTLPISLGLMACFFPEGKHFLFFDICLVFLFP